MSSRSEAKFIFENQVPPEYSRPFDCLLKKPVTGRKVVRGIDDIERDLGSSAAQLDRQKREAAAKNPFLNTDASRADIYKLVGDASCVSSVPWKTKQQIRDLYYKLPEWQREMIFGGDPFLLGLAMDRPDPGEHHSRLSTFEGQKPGTLGKIIGKLFGV